jgi:hypothetical protein
VELLMAEFIVESIKHTPLQQTRSVAHIFRILLAHKFALSDPVATLAGFCQPDDAGGGAKSAGEKKWKPSWLVPLTTVD